MGVFPESLTKSLEHGTVIPFVGAGVSMSVMTRPAPGQPRRRLFPSWSDLIAQAAGQLERENKEPEAVLVKALLGVTPPRYLDAATEALRGLGARWAKFLKSALDPSFEKADGESLRLARAVWALNSKLVITTNYDHVLRWSCPTPADCAEWDVEAPAEFASLMREGITRPTIWHLHGRIDNAAGIVLTADGYHRLYGLDGSRSEHFKAALRTLQSLLMSRTLVFLGFSFDDEHFAAQIESLNETFEGCAGPHFLLVRRREFEKVMSRVGSLPIELIAFEEFGDPLTATVEALARFTRPLAATRATIVNPVPQLRWRGGHFAEETTGLEAYLDRVGSPYRDLVQRVQGAVRRRTADLGLDPVWERHREQVLAYLGQLVPDEIKAAELTEFELACLCVLGQRSIELSLRRRNDDAARALTAAVERELSGSPDLAAATGAVAEAWVANQDVVFRADSDPGAGASGLDFLLACLRLATEIDLALNRFPRQVYEDLCPYHDLGAVDFAAGRYRIDRIDLNYNLHEIAIHATCGDPEIHQVLATLTDYLNQTLHAVGPPLDARYISLLKVRLQVRPMGYEGQHHEFRTQVSTVISMFMGEELYGDQRIFLRELLQNARDAVLTRATVRRAAGEAFAPRIAFECDRKAGTLTCRDNGIGMDRYTIERYLADVGRSFYTSDDYRNLVAGATDEQESPVSRFGIGILSCFMVASKVTIRTRQEGKPGFRIEIPSRGAFFFVRQDPTVVDVGTEVRLDLLPAALRDDAVWRRSFSNRLTSEVDSGILVEHEGKMLPAKKQRVKRALTWRDNWKLPRLLAAYAVCFPFAIEILEDGVRSSIARRRLLQSVLNRDERVRIGRSRWSYTADANDCKLIVEDESVRFKAVVLRMSSEVQVFSSGGIYVPTYRDFNLHALGLPKWSGYVVDFAPERVRINLARSTILGFRATAEEGRRAWDCVEEQLTQLPIADVVGRENAVSVVKQSTALYQVVETFPPEGKAFGEKLLLKDFHVCLFRFTGPDCIVWLSPLAEFGRAGVTSLYKVEDDVRPDELGLSIERDAPRPAQHVAGEPAAARPAAPDVQRRPVARAAPPPPEEVELFPRLPRFSLGDGAFRAGFPDDRFKSLVERGKRRGCLTFDDVVEILPEGTEWTDEIYELVEVLDDFGIELTAGLELGSGFLDRDEIDDDSGDEEDDETSGDEPKTTRPRGPSPTRVAAAWSPGDVRHQDRSRVDASTATSRVSTSGNATSPTDRPSGRVQGHDDGRESREAEGPSPGRVAAIRTPDRVYLYASKFEEAARFVGLSGFTIEERRKAPTTGASSSSSSGYSSSESPRQKASRELTAATGKFLAFVTTARPMGQWVRLDRVEVGKHLAAIEKCRQALIFAEQEEKKIKEQMDSKGGTK